MNFFRTVIAVCSGPSVFPKLIDRNPLRVLFHLFLICFLLAFVVTIFKSFEVNREKKILVTELGNYFGALTVSKKGILPERHADRQKTFLLTEDRRLDYLTDKSLSGLDSMSSWQENAGIFWTECGIYLWKRFPDERNTYGMLQLPLPFSGQERNISSMFLFRQFTGEQIKQYLAEHAFLKQGASYPVEESVTIPPQTIAADIVSGFIVFLFGTAFLALFLLSAAMTVLFAWFQSILSSRLEKKLTFRQVLGIMVYAAFPALLLTAAAMIFELPYLQFQMVFFIVFFIYQIPAYGAVQRVLNPPPPKPPEDENDDFF